MRLHWANMAVQALWPIANPPSRLRILISFFPHQEKKYGAGEADGYVYLPLMPYGRPPPLSVLQPDLFVFVRHDFWLR